MKKTIPILLAVVTVAVALAKSAPILTGTVSRYTLAPRGEVDGLLLKDGTSVKFPPHLGAELTDKVKAGDTVVVTLEGSAPSLTKFGRGVRAVSIADKTTGKSITDTPPAAPPKPPHPPGVGDETRNQLSANGKISQFLVNDHGEVDGLILSEGTQVKFPPHIGGGLMPLIEDKKPADVVASGPGIKTDNGTVIDATALSYDGKAIGGLDHGPRKHP